MVAEPEHPIRDAAVDVLGGTPPSLVRPPVDPATLVLPEPLARRVRAFDAAVDGWFERLRGNPTADRLFYGASAVGDFSLIWHVVGAARALGGPTREREAARLAASLAVESVVVNGFVKSLFRRTRPASDQHRPRRLRQPRSSSFPSGHATSGFMAAALLGSGRPRRTKMTWVAAAGFVAASRVHVRIHHASDVVAGAVIGTGLGVLVKRMWPLGNVRRGRGY